MMASLQVAPKLRIKASIGQLEGVLERSEFLTAKTRIILVHSAVLQKQKGGEKTGHGIADDGKGWQLAHGMGKSFPVPRDRVVADLEAVEGVRDGSSGIFWDMNEQNAPFPYGGRKSTFSRGVAEPLIGEGKSSRKDCHLRGYLRPPPKKSDETF